MNSLTIDSTTPIHVESCRPAPNGRKDWLGDPITQAYDVKYGWVDYVNGRATCGLLINNTIYENFIYCDEEEK